MEKSTAKESKSLSEADVEKLFHTKRLPRLPWSLLLVLYAPFGLFLTFLRICMSLQVILLLVICPAGSVKRFMLRVFFGVLGIVVITDSFHRKSSQTKIYVSNRVSLLDHVVFYLALDCITVSSGGVAAPLLHFFFPHRRLASRSPDDLEIEAKKMPEFDESRSTETVVPFAIQPEPLPTNGSHSLFQFSDWPCRLATDVQPIALTARRPFGIKLCYSSQWWDLFWTLFVPTTVFRVKLLAPMERREGEDGGQLSQRVQESLREELKLQESQVTMDNVTAWLKASRKGRTPGVSPTPRPRAVTTTTTTSQTPATPPPSSREPTGLDRMVDQVSAVLPQVPHTTIRKDLLRTQSVDATIANFLEGVVTYDPIPSPPAKPAPKPLPPPSYITSTPPTFKSSSLRPRKYYSPAMEAMHRQLSLEERKRELVQKARQSYIEKTRTEREWIAAELLHNKFSIGDDSHTYLSSFM